MAHIAMFSIPAPGHVLPALDLFAELVRRGHRVSYANDPSMRATVEATGAELKPYTSVLPGLGENAETGAEDAFAGDVIDQLTVFADEYENQLPQWFALYEDDRPDLILYDIAGAMSLVLARSWNIPTLQISPTYVAWEGYADDMAEFHTMLRTDPRGVAMLARQDALLARYGIETDSLVFIGTPERSLVLIAPSMQPNIERVDRAIYTFTGPARRLPAAAPSGGERPITLLVSFGSAFTDQPVTYRAACDLALARPDWRVILQVGGRTEPATVTASDGTLPGNVEVHRWIDQVAVLQETDVFLTHAGMGGSTEAMLTGTPVITAPQAADQFENAEMLAAAGIAVPAPQTPTGVALGQACDAALQLSGRAAELAAELADLGGLDRAVDVVLDRLPA
ncbi:macrolide family glycosyltransferase [Tsukamurella paurometabola]|uniref:Glycosyltransferase, MGT family n=1 Tax=Tsukamurella paurometabola (strain ATCC 8368 / DSM 20162 / CCUG 35730 / CIP 100753 / JCM 10117 / KCTC 9821 / NBRC 16120 / NCIMB 702349 / NCTC 13040) TaxID=521096 RepID=D5UQH2_TSUPD|nr:glycosyltransferase, MGT family [Tsukamurella paurometabola DSM 20162]